MRISDWSSDGCSSDLIAYRGSDGPEDIEASGTLWVDGQPLAALGVPLVTPKGEKPIAQMAELQKRLYPGDQWHPQFDDALDYARRIRDKYEPLGYTFEAVGHGLGGSEAQLVAHTRSEEHTSELQSLMRISYAVFC